MRKVRLECRSCGKMSHAVESEDYEGWPASDECGCVRDKLKDAFDLIKVHTDADVEYIYDEVMDMDPENKHLLWTGELIFD